MKILAQLYGAARTQVYVGAEARRRVKAEAGRFGVLHLATRHPQRRLADVLAGGARAQSAGEDGGEDGVLEAWRSLKLDLKADLVVLSACDTGRGRIGAGEGDRVDVGAVCRGQPDDGGEPVEGGVGQHDRVDVRVPPEPSMQGKISRLHSAGAQGGRQDAANCRLSPPLLLGWVRFGSVMEDEVIADFFNCQLPIGYRRKILSS